MPQLREFIGPPVAVMFARIWPDLPPELMAGLLAEFRAHYDGEGCLNSRTYSEVPEVLERLSGAGMFLFVLTNKPIRPTRAILAHVGLAGLFREVVTPDFTDPPFRTKSEGAKWLRANHSLDPASTVVVGDGMDDAEAAEACGFEFLAIRYGYGRAHETKKIRPLAVLEKFSDMENVLL
ncbi:MAG: HAD family hydrolase, partial [Terrimicrobiaceae bacterium]